MVRDYIWGSTSPCYGGTRFPQDSLAIYPSTFSRNIAPYIPQRFTMLGRYSLTIYSYQIVGRRGGEEQIEDFFPREAKILNVSLDSQFQIVK